ncbi:unnamed protein product [Colias eurytheme]|nr:unnamed protein product [Colias eurytheme]
MDLTDAKKKYPSSMNRPNEMFSVGLIGVYDFGTMSPFTMIDTTVVIFAIVATAIAFARSLIVRALYLALSSCIEVQITVTPHYLLFVMIPLSVEFMHMHKIYIFYVYMNLTVALVPGLILIMNKINEVRLLNDVQQQISAIIWVAFSLITVAMFQIKTVARYILRNNLIGIFRSTPRYGPLDPDDRKRRKYFDEICLYRQCKHDCIVMSEKFECNHLPLIFKNKSPTSESTESSITNIYHASTERKRFSSVVDLVVDNREV